jgi:hypothetical protein
MFGFLKSDPRKALKKQYLALLEEAMKAQRNGDIRGYSELTEQAEAVSTKIDLLDKEAALQTTPGKQS